MLLLLLLLLLLLEGIVALALDVLSPDVLNAVAEEVARTNSILCSNNGSFEFCCDFNFFSISIEDRFLFGIV